MTAQPNSSQAQATTEAKTSDKEINFRQQEAALRQKYEREIQAERSARQEAERKAQELAARHQQEPDDDEEGNEPYVDHKKLTKQLNKFGQSTQTNIQKSMEAAKEAAKEEIKQEMWLDEHGDFEEILTKHADDLAAYAPDLAKSLLRMPNNFDRQKLVYENIKALSLHKPKDEKKSAVQDRIDANKRSPYYQPSGIGAAPYGISHGGKDYSQTDQKNAYNKLLELKNRLRLG